MFNFKGEFALIPDIEIVSRPVLSSDLGAQPEAEYAEYIVVSPHTRQVPKGIDSKSAQLLEEFRKPTTIVQAVVRYWRKVEPTADPDKLLSDAFPLLQHFILNKLLVPADSPDLRRIHPSLEAGVVISDYQILRCIQVLEDTEVYLAQNIQGTRAALKLARPHHSVATANEREARILRWLDGRFSPLLVDQGVYQDQPFLITSWCEGINAARAAYNLRSQASWQPAAEIQENLLLLLRNIVAAYVHLHSQGVLHGDIHPGNILVNDQLEVKLIDFGHSRLLTGTDQEIIPRVGIPFYLDPEYAEARIADQSIPSATFASEQYCLATLLYELITGSSYLNFSPDLATLWQQIVVLPVLPFTFHGVPAWAALEDILKRALSKSSERRFSDMAVLGVQLAKVSPKTEELIPDSHRESVYLSRTAPFLKEFLTSIKYGQALSAAAWPELPTSSFRDGSTGLAYFLLRAARINESADLWAQSDLWITRALREAKDPTAFYDGVDLLPSNIGQVSPYHTESGVHYVDALIAYAIGDIERCSRAVNRFIELSSLPTTGLDLGSGLAGTVLTGTLLFRNLGKLLPDTTKTALRALCQAKLLNLWKNLIVLPPILQNTTVVYLGAAHGWAGILYSTLVWTHFAGETPSAEVIDRLQQLEMCGESAGQGMQWRWTINGSGTENYMPGWCNGSAGYVYLWTMAHQILGDSRYLEMAERAAINAYHNYNGLGNICCGSAGRAFALLHLYKYTGEAVWLTRAKHVASDALQRCIDEPLSAYSLFRGKTGAALLAVELEKPEWASMPMFEI